MRSHRAAGRGGRLYELLELERDAGAADIKKAYRRLAVENHPDKGGDPERFKEIAHAYEVLSNSEKRRLYDEHGEDAVQRGFGNPSDIFDMLFGRPGGPSKARQRTKDIVHPLEVSLEQLYTGCTRKLAVQRDVVDEDAGIRACEPCGGTGVGPGAARALMPHIPAACTACSGTGKTYKVRRVRELLEVVVEKGAPHGHRVVFPGKADERPDCQPGDVVVVLHQQEHPEFTRRGADLFLTREIGLLEALTGFRMVVTHLDKRRFVVRTLPGEVVQPLAEGSGLRAVKGEGMPTHGQPFVLGTLFLVLPIRFPDTVDPALAAQLRRALPGPENVVDEEGAEICHLEDLDPTPPSWPGPGSGPESHSAPGPVPPGCPQQ